MKNVKAVLACCLAVFMMVSLFMTGCGSGEPGAASEPAAESTAAPAEEATAEPTEEATAETLASEPERKETITIRVYPPAGWVFANVIAWKDGGDSAFGDAGEQMEESMEEMCFKLSAPGWIDRLVICAEVFFYDVDSDTDFGTVQTQELSVEPGRDLWIGIWDDEGTGVDIFYEDPFAGMDFGPAVPVEEEPMYEDPISLAAEAGDFETVKSLLPTLEDRSILNEWVFNDFNEAYAVESILSGDYETAIEFFGYCASKNSRPYADAFRQLVDGDVEAALDTLQAMDYPSLDRDMDMSWAEIICTVIGVEEAPSDLNYILKTNYLTRRLKAALPSTLTEDVLTFGENSAWEAERYIGEFIDQGYYIAVDDLSGLYRRCGSEANGKMLILRGQKDFPSGKTYYAVDMMLMEYLSHDLYPYDLSEVEYILLADYGYINEGRYRQTLSAGDNSVSDEFTFLRMTGQVRLIDPATGAVIEQSPQLTGTGEVDAYFSDLGYQCSNMPETGSYIMDFMEKVCELNA